MIESIKNIFSIPDLRKRVLYSLGLLAVYRIGGHIATPGVRWQALERWFAQTQGGGLLGFVDLFAGGNLRRFTIFALGIMPYVSASIILQLLTVISPTLERLSKEGEVGRRKITQWTRYGTVALSIIQAGAIATWLQSVNVGGGGERVVASSLSGWPFVLLTILTLTTGTAFIMWLGEQISDRGIGNGISLIIFAGIVVNLPSAVFTTLSQVGDGTISPLVILILCAVMVAVVAGIVFVERAQRKIPIQYARRVVGRKIYGGQSTYLPLRVNSGGVIPVIFASSILAIPQTLLQWLADKSLVVLDEQAVEPRYRMLETIREYALRKLEESGEASRQVKRGRDPPPGGVLRWGQRGSCPDAYLSCQNCLGDAKVVS
jgi:preprotein translocase subunit SecY